MASLDMDELVSQAEAEGVTLAEMITRSMTPKQINEMQRGLNGEIAENYHKIESFMREVKVASLEELMELQGAVMTYPHTILEAALSDDSA